MCALFPSSRSAERVQHARILSRGFCAPLHPFTVCGLTRRSDRDLSSQYLPICASCRYMHLARLQTGLPFFCLIVCLEEIVSKF